MPNQLFLHFWKFPWLFAITLFSQPFCQELWSAWIFLHWPFIKLYFYPFTAHFFQLIWTRQRSKKFLQCWPKKSLCDATISEYGFQISKTLAGCHLNLIQIVLHTIYMQALPWKAAKSFQTQQLYSHTWLISQSCGRLLLRSQVSHLSLSSSLHPISVVFTLELGSFSLSHSFWCIGFCSLDVKVF